MDFKGLGKSLSEKINEAKDTVTKEAVNALDDFNEALPTMRALGFTIKNLKVGMGVIPEIGATLVASTDTIDVKKVKELIETHSEKKALVLALKGLEAAFNLKQQITDLPLKGVQVDLVVSLPPRVDVSFVKNAE